MIDAPSTPIMDTAAAVFEQVIAESETALPPRMAAPSTEALDPTARLRDGIAAALHLFTDAVLQVVDGVIDAFEPDAAEPDTTLTVQVRAGATATTSLWLHNMTPAPVDGIILRLTRCTAHDGAVLDVGDVVFEPAKLDLAAGSSEHSAMTIAVSASAARGTYHGHVLASGLPDTVLTVRLVVS